MSKRRYRTTDVNKVNWERIAESAGGSRVVFGIDVAKEKFVGALLNSEREVMETLRWRHPEQTRGLVEDLEKSLGADRVEVVMEPSGTYGDCVWGLFEEAGFTLFRVSPKRVHDAAEVYDGVPSLHDAKAAYLIGRLHWDGGSRQWLALPGSRRELKAAVSLMDFHRERYQGGVNRLEGLLARHWPEAERMMVVGSVSLLNLLARYGAAAEVAAHGDEAKPWLRRWGGAQLREEKIQRLLDSTRSSVGLACSDGERRYLQTLAQETLDSYRSLREAQKQVEQRALADATVAPLAPVVGKVTSAVLVATQGTPLDYANAASYLKSLGLNLKEKSSGKHQGQLKITKRGPSLARKYLYLATLRLIQNDPIVQCWYQRKVQRDGGCKGKAIVAIMRKLAKSLWHVARGRAFDSQALFNIRALNLGC
jgi:transposase